MVAPVFVHVHINAADGRLLESRGPRENAWFWVAVRPVRDDVEKKIGVSLRREIAGGLRMVLACWRWGRKVWVHLFCAELARGRLVGVVPLWVYFGTSQVPCCC